MMVVADPIFEARDIARSYGGVAALKGVSFAVAKGEIVGLIGPNGSGKTTLFNCLLGQLRADAGTVSFRGSDITGWRANRLARAGLGRTFQLLQVFGGLTVRNNLIAAAQEHRGSLASRLFAPRNLGLDDKVEQMLERFRLTALGNAPAASLSYGQQKLLDLAMALMADPDIVFLDEPAGGVTPSMLDDIGEILLELNRDTGTTFAIIEHNMDFIMGLSHRVVVLAEGAVLTSGTPDEVRRDERVIEAYLGR